MLTDQAPARALDPTPLLEALDFVREHQDQADHFGGTGDERDFYHLLDRLSDGVSRSFRSYCRAGCGGCCHYPIAMFTTTFTEWDVVRRYIETEYTQAQRVALVRRYRATFTGFWRLVLTFLQRSSLMLVVTAPAVYRAQIACPFLVDSSCSVYPARPYQCRTFGLFAVREFAHQPKVYACNVQGENLLAQTQAAGPQVQLPVSNAIAARIRLMCQGPKLSLPIWAGIWVSRWEAGRAVPGEGRHLLEET
ncbi:MAG: YkgJ family cysteine cluster protein [Candidatus Sericytochromatia bacterium]